MNDFFHSHMSKRQDTVMIISNSFEDTMSYKVGNVIPIGQLTMIYACKTQYNIICFIFYH